MNLRKTLTTRYAIGLIIIASVLLAAFWTLTQKIESNADSAYMVNTAGMQRMLSQRIALAASQAIIEPTHASRTPQIAILSQALNKMQQNHAILVDRLAQGENVHGADIHNQLTPKVTKFIGAGQFIVTQHQSKAFENVKDSPQYALIVSALKSEFLSELDDVVTALQVGAEAKTAGFLRLEAVFLGIGIITLLFEAGLIFRPMVNTVSETVDSLEVANEELREFSFRISHDLRAPIASALGLSEIAIDSLGSKDIEEAIRATKRISFSMRKLDKLIEDILRVTRNKNAIAEHQPIAVSNVTEQIFEKLSELYEHAIVELRNKVPSDAQVVSNKVYFEQILENLVSNGIKYCDPEKSARFVEVSFEKLDNRTRLIVSDNGLGVPAAFRDKLFTMFQRFHPTVSFGTGLGLYLVKQNAQAIGGEIKFVAAPAGSRFILELPND